MCPPNFPQAQALAIIRIYTRPPTLTLIFPHPRSLHPHRMIDHSMPMVGSSTSSQTKASTMYTRPIKLLLTQNILGAVMAYLEDHGDVIPPSQELWLRDMEPHEDGLVPLRCLVNHAKQIAVLVSPCKVNGDSERDRVHHGCADDRLDAKYRYWSFMESHPAHTSLPLDAHQDAMNALNWASSDELLPPRRSVPAPFTREECQRLTALLQSIGQQGETPLRTRTVSKIFLRIVCWRQSHFRPNKRLPVDADHDALYRSDHSTPPRSSALILTATMCACLATAISLCLSRRLHGLLALERSSFCYRPWGRVSRPMQEEPCSYSQ
ncbi:hypothetical protein BD779DRAFT_540904 [Infundibulicybe gibba]|nr:hypothetical protein BD779DRAFT_540904 [Infundibulicybe gibba]